MRDFVVVALSGAFLAGLAACSNPGAKSAGGASAATPVAQNGPLQELPHRRAGLWRQTMVLEGSNRQMPAIQACSDAASEAKLTLLGQHRERDLCQSQTFSRNPDGSIAFNVSCDLGPRGKTVSTGTISGDFNSSYKIAMDSKTTGAPVTQLDTERKMTITATWMGACATGQRGGDMILADGRKINLTDPSPGAGYP
jgi:hypothetical protein